MRHTLLLVDDEPMILSALKRLLLDEPYEILTAGDAEQAAAVLAKTSVDLIICDEDMPGMPGSEFLARVAREYPDIVRIVLTGHATLPTALRAINEGRVYQYFTKPWNGIDLAIAIRRAIEQKDLLTRSRDLLEVTKQQTSLLDQARMKRRLQPPPAEAQPRPMSARQLMDEMDHEVNRSRKRLESTRDSPEGDEGEGVA